MNITVTEVNSRLEASFAYDAAIVQLVKSFGCRWDPAKRVWWTKDEDTALKLKSAAGQDVSAAIAERNKTIRAAVEASRASFADMDIPAPSGKTYLPFQRAGIAYGADRDSVLIGDDMGLGKTIQAIGLLNVQDAKKVLIICPASIKLNWRNELKKWLVKPLNIGIAEGKSYPVSDVVIINYDIVAKHLDQIRMTEWDAIIVDEAHYLKNPKSARAKAILGEKETKPLTAKRKIVLTGTPIPNRPIELFPVANWLFPSAFSSFFGFAKKFCNARQGSYGWDFTGSSNLDELQEQLRVAGMVRRLKMDVLTELPPKTRQIVEIQGASAIVKKEADAWESREEKVNALRVALELSKASDNPDDYSKAAEALGEATSAAFSEMSTLRHETAVAKVLFVVQHLIDALEDGRKIVFFCHHKDVAGMVRDDIQEAGYGVVCGTGDMSVEQRQASVEKFQRDPNTKLFIATIMAMGVGHTLTAASHVVFGELDWVPGNVTQAEDRCHRIGQKDNVLIQHIVLENSIDARMVEILIEKQSVIDQALDRSLDRSFEVSQIAPEPVAVVTPSKQRAASETTTRDKIGEIAEKLTDEMVDLISQALGILSGRNMDYAQEQNGIGFNKLDTQIGMHLAYGRLTKRQSALGLKVCMKYNQTQLGGLLNPCKEVANAK